MIPLFVTLEFLEGFAWSGRIWLPVFLVWLFLLPLVLCFAPLICLGSWVLGLNPLEPFRVVLGILRATRGTQVQIGFERRRVEWVVH